MIQLSEGPLQALDRYYDRMAARNEVVPPGYSMEPIGFVIALADDGTIVDVRPWLDAGGKRPRSVQVPKWFGRSGRGSTPFFLWDNATYALGVIDDTKKATASDKEKPKRDHEAFKKLHLEQLKDEKDVGLAALRSFLERWTPEQFVAPLFEKHMLKQNVAFRLDGELHFIHERPAAKRLTEKLKLDYEKTGEKSAFCLVRGDYLPIARLHTKIKGVDGTASAEVPLVSFNEEAFESYHHEQGDNAPTSQDAVFRYTAALNRLLDRASPNRIRIGDATTVFWADTSEIDDIDEAAAAAAEDAFAMMMEPPDDETEAVKLRDVLDCVRDGRPMANADPKLHDRTRFHVLGLSPNAARLSVRFWLSDDVSAFAKRLTSHYDDLRIEPVPWKKPPSIQRLLINAVVPDVIRGKGNKAIYDYLEKNERLLFGEVARSVLTGKRYPQSLLTSAIMRLRAGDPKTKDGKSGSIGWHAASIRAVLFRDQRLRRSDPDIPKPGETPMSLKKDHSNTGYQLGRLFAVYELAQQSALGKKVNATIRDRFFGSASATPAGIFPIIIRGAQNHLSKIRKEKPGWATLIEKELEEIHSHIDPAEPRSLPRSLRLHDQGEFAIGYYHQRAAKLRSEKGEQISFDDIVAEDEDQGNDE